MMQRSFEIHRPLKNRFPKALIEEAVLFYSFAVDEMVDRGCIPQGDAI
jgi:hypothetical protein